MTPLLTVTIFFAVAAGITAIVAAVGKCPQWVPVILLCVVALLIVLPK